MRIIDILKKDEVTISCELFPPKEWSALEGVQKVAKEIAQLKPSFMSVTYGAGGGTSQHTAQIAHDIQNEYGVPALAHLTCVSSTKELVTESLDKLKEKKIENILALRGDIPPTGQCATDFSHASELIEMIRSKGDFCVGGACYPEGHPESPSIDKDLEFVKAKVESGCEFLTTQMFFDNNILYNYMFKLLKKGIDVPVVAGIMPVTNGNQIVRICQLSGSLLPARFHMIVDRFSHNPAAMKQAGIAYATDQIIDLIANGINNIHIYTMNKPDVAASIMDNLSEIFVRD